MNNEIVRFRDKDPDGCGPHDIVVDAKFRFSLSKKQRKTIEEVAADFEYDPGYETLEQFAEAVLDKCLEHKCFKDDGQRWKFVRHDIVVEIKV